MASTTSRKSFVSDSPAMPISLAPMMCASPVRSMPPPTMKSPAIMITTGLENPARASDGVSIPSSSRAITAHRATMSGRSLLVANSNAEMDSMVSVAIIFVVDL